MLTERDLFVDDPGSGHVPASGGVFEADLPLREVERRHILRTLQRVHGNRTEAARVLGISVRCLQYKLKAYTQAADASSTTSPAETGLHFDPPPTVGTNGRHHALSIEQRSAV